MFWNSEPDEEKTVWSAQVLTLDYLIAGQITEEDANFIIDQLEETDSEIWTVLLMSVDMWPTGNLRVPERSVAEWSLILNDTLVAYIPRDPLSQEAFEEMLEEWADDEATEVLVEMYVGSYLVRGKVVWDEDNYICQFVKDAEIECLQPKTQLTKLQAPYVMLNPRLIQGIVER